MQPTAERVLKIFSVRRIVVPIVIGLMAAAYLLIKNFDKEAFLNLSWSWNSTFWMLMALFAVFVRDFAYMVRIRALTDNDVNWWQAFNIIMLWEFSSAVVPGILGGGYFVAIYILSRERINMGRSITAITLSSFQDGVFLAIMAPLVYFIVGKDRLFATIDLNDINPVSFSHGFFYSFWTVYSIILAYKIFVAYALFINPRWVKWALVKIFSLPFLKRWKPDALETGNQLIIASKGLKNKSFRFWFNSWTGTFASWTARYTIVNCIILAFIDVPIDNVLLFGRQVVMGIIILIAPTPGGSGLAEFMFSDFLGEFIPKGLSASLGLLWRLMSYYPYLFIGAILIPTWIGRVFGKHHEKTN
jgi:uncharacterized protein (TIRG00374 family)